MKDSRVFLVGVLAAFVSMSAGAYEDNVLPDSVVMPCERHVEVKDITRLVVPMTPFRGVNLIFPFELNEASTSYSLSSDLVWDFREAAGTALVPIYFSNFSDQWGELADFTVTTGDYIFSITLKADPNLKNHCSNVVFDFSDEQIKKIREGEKKEYLAALDAQYQEKFAELDEQAANKALELVASLSKGNPSDTGIHEYDTLELSNGDEVELYIEEIQGWGEFSIILAEVSNDSQVSPLYIEDVEVGRLKNGQKTPLNGHPDIEPKLPMDSVAEMTFTTTDNIPETGGYMRLLTDRGVVEVTW
jgi:hypothetical protein